jgi:alcohol dehydrogenase class IV
VDGVAGLLRRIGLTRTLKDYGVTEKDFPAMVESAHKSTFHIKTNPRPVDDALLLEVLGKS